VADLRRVGGGLVLGRLWHHQWSFGDAIALAGVVATVVVAVFGPTRRWLVRRVRAGLLWAGRPERRYATWFIQKWGQYENPYLDDVESLDLSNTFVSLSFSAQDTGQETRTVATAVLADRRAGNLVIEGAPGSGKSTLLKAYGVGTLRLRGRVLRVRRPGGDIPFFVQLRKLSRWLDQHAGAGLASYLVEEVLVSGAGMDRTDATDFLRYVLAENRVLVLLDGLDEVAADRHDAVLEAVYKFRTDRNQALPTHQARLVVTCRRQNLLAVRDRWVPVIARTVCTLAPLRNSEIFSYLDKLRGKFKTPAGPENFFQAVRASGTLDLHRVPLILAMSVGLYARKDFYEIPSSIARLYRTMVEELLDRHKFKGDPGGSVLRYTVADKHRYLREFALESAVGGGFNDFGRAELTAFAKELAPHLDAVQDPREFVAEIVERSGLLTDASEAGQFVFAHRSIHEHLVVEELRLRPDGPATLLARATDPEWRQVAIFYATAQDQRSADELLDQLVRRNAALAGHCLAGARASDGVAATILDALGIADPVHLAAGRGHDVSPPGGAGDGGRPAGGPAARAAHRGHRGLQRRRGRHAPAARVAGRQQRRPDRRAGAADRRQRPGRPAAGGAAVAVPGGARDRGAAGGPGHRGAAAHHRERPGRSGRAAAAGALRATVPDRA
jgi:hypothetical protein